MTRLPIFPALLVAFSLVAQEAPKVQSPAGAPTKLTLQGAIETSLKNNLQVQIASETRDFTRAGVLLEQGTFDWNLTSSINLSKTQDASWSSATTAAFTSSDDHLLPGLTVGSAKAFGWGGNLSLNYAPTYSLARAP
ncbi:MAG: hypothetical protein IPO28_10085 [Holophagaceae bacterium]|nr:hypothetical protein [Holophagaceae bacterium]